MKTILDVRHLLKLFGIFIYTRSRKGDAELMELEINELFKQGLIGNEDYLNAKMLLQKEKSKK